MLVILFARLHDRRDKIILVIILFLYITGDGKKNSVPETGGKPIEKPLAPVRGISTALPPRNTTNSTATVGTATTPDVTNATQSSALDDAQLQRTLLKPKFLTENSSTVVAQTGASSRISCLVANLGDCVVSPTKSYVIEWYWGPSQMSNIRRE